jgi:hypothetical protein
MMGYRKFEIILFSEETSKVRRVKLHGFLCALLISVYILSVGMLTWTEWDYSMMRSKVQQIAELERENEEQRTELLQMSGRVMKIVQVLDEIRAIDDEDEIILNLEKAYGDIQVQHMNNPGSDLGMPHQITTVDYDDLAGCMNSVLAYVGNEIDGRGSGGKQIARRVGHIRSASADQRYDAVPMSGTGSKESIIKKVRAIAIELGIAPRLALSMAKVESGFDPRAVSPKGAIGVLQLIPFFVCQEYEVSPEMLFDPEVNIRIGLSYMKSLLERFDENLDLSLAAYNAGAKRVVKAGYDIPPIEETRDYVKKVKEAMREGRVDLSTPPTDGRQNSAAREPS